MIVLDTDVLSGLRDGSNGHLRQWLAALLEAPTLASYSVVEIQFGIARVRGRDPAFAERLSAWLDRVIATTHILPLTAAAARLAGEMRAVTALQALEGDLVIAATALAAGASVATLNLRDFRLIARHFPELHVVDPLGSR